LVTLLPGAISAQGKDLLVELLWWTWCCTPLCWGLLCSHFFTVKSSSFVPKKKVFLLGESNHNHLTIKKPYIPWHQELMYFFNELYNTCKGMQRHHFIIAPS
jgi:hypothetical protein